MSTDIVKTEALAELRAAQFEHSWERVQSQTTATAKTSPATPKTSWVRRKSII